MEPDPEKRFTIAEVRKHPWFVHRRGENKGDDSGKGPSSTNGDGIISRSSSDWNWW